MRTQTGEAAPIHNNRAEEVSRPGLSSRTRNLITIAIFVAAVTFGVADPSFAACDPAIDETCIAPTPVIAVLDQRQLSGIMSLLGISAALSLATFVWHASAPYRLKGSRRD
jgi:hypothetical protein